MFTEGSNIVLTKKISDKRQAINSPASYPIIMPFFVIREYRRCVRASQASQIRLL